MNKINETIQWLGALGIIGGHLLNSMGPEYYPWNIVSFFTGTCLFMVWCIRVGNKPQLAVNVVAFLLGVIGLIRAFG
jgi:hypothetical protein